MERIRIDLTPEAAASATLPNPLTIAWSPPTQHRRREIIVMADAASGAVRPIRSKARSRLLAGIARARLWLDAIMAGRIADTNALTEQESISEDRVPERGVALRRSGGDCPRSRDGGL